MQKQDNDSQENDVKKAYSAYSRIFGAVIKMIVTILIFSLAGTYADKQMSSDTPWCTIVGSLSGISIALYFGFKDFLRND